MINLNTILIREQIIKSIRDFFYSQNFHEIIIPVLNRSVPLEPNIYPFKTTWNTQRGNQTLYLSTSPERRLKQMIALGINNCFGIGSSFRNLENSGSLHSPEFLMLEWYRKDATYVNIMDDTQKLLTFIYKSLSKKNEMKINLSEQWKKISLISLFKRYLKLDLIKVIENKKILFDVTKKRGYNTKNTTWGELYDQLFVNEIESHLPFEPFFLIDFPSRISPLCKSKKDNLLLAERFELYINRMEIANGNTENTNVESIEKHFFAEQKKRSQKCQPIDTEFIKSINKMNNTSYAGIGLGIDRLTMLFSASTSIDELKMLT